MGLRQKLAVVHAAFTALGLTEGPALITAVQTFVQGDKAAAGNLSDLYGKAQDQIQATYPATQTSTYDRNRYLSTIQTFMENTRILVLAQYTAYCNDTVEKYLVDKEPAIFADIQTMLGYFAAAYNYSSGEENAYTIACNHFGRVKYVFNHLDTLAAQYVNSPAPVNVTTDVNDAVVRNSTKLAVWIHPELVKANSVGDKMKPFKASYSEQINQYLLLYLYYKKENNLRAFFMAHYNVIGCTDGDWRGLVNKLDPNNNVLMNIDMAQCLATLGQTENPFSELLKTQLHRLLQSIPAIAYWNKEAMEILYLKEKTILAGILTPPCQQLSNSSDLSDADLISAITQEIVLPDTDPHQRNAFKDLVIHFLAKNHFLTDEDPTYSFPKQNSTPPSNSAPPNSTPSSSSSRGSCMLM